MPDRTIDLAAYLPEVLRDVREMRAICDAGAPTVKAEWDALDAAMNDQFISTATEDGIARYERMLGIVPYATDTPDDRRFRLLARFGDRAPYTRRGLDTMLTSLCGSDGYRLSYPGAFTVSVQVALSAKKQERVVYELLERVLPYNMAYTVTLLYNTWDKVKQKTWSAAGKGTWAALREEVL